MNRPVYFGLPAENPFRLADFYCAVFGWKQHIWEGIDNYVLLFTGGYDKPGINGSIMGKYMPATVLTMEVADIDQALRKVVEKGGRITNPKSHVDTLGDFAWCKDLDDHYFCLAQFGAEYDETMNRLTPEGAENEEWENRPIHFEIPSSDPEKAVDFYRDIFGWIISKWSGDMDYYLITTGESNTPGIDGAIMPLGNNRHVVNTIGVKNIDSSIEKVLANGGKLLMPKEFIPGVGLFCYCLDVDDNQFGILQPEM